MVNQILNMRLNEMAQLVSNEFPYIKKEDPSTDNVSRDCYDLENLHRVSLVWDIVNSITNIANEHKKSKIDVNFNCPMDIRILFIVQKCFSSNGIAIFPNYSLELNEKTNLAEGSLKKIDVILKDKDLTTIQVIKASSWHQKDALNFSLYQTMLDGDFLGFQKYRRLGGDPKNTSIFGKTPPDIANLYCRLAVYFEKGMVFEKNIERAFHYYLLASKCGHHKAIVRLGMCHLYGKGTPVNFGLAEEAFMIGAECLNPQAQYFYGNMLLNRGSKDENLLIKAKSYLESAAKQGYIKAQSRLELCKKILATMNSQALKNM